MTECFDCVGSESTVKWTFVCGHAYAMCDECAAVEWPDLCIECESADPLLGGPLIELN